MKKNKEKLAKRFEVAKTVTDTKKYHCIEPIDDKKMRFKLFSEDDKFKTVTMI